MSSITHGAASALVAEVRALARGEARRAAREVRRSASGTVERRDRDGTWHVLVDGAAEATPVNGDVLATLSVGDRVSLRVEGSRLSVTGNASDPAQGAAAVAEAVDPALASAREALDGTARAAEAAEAADAHAMRASEAAASAEGSATDARGSADAALYQLSVVEDVVGTVEWLAAHADYVRTGDEEAVPGKQYWVRSKGWHRTADTAVVAGKSYWWPPGTEITEVVSAGESGIDENGNPYHTATVTRIRTTASWEEVEDPKDSEVARYWEQGEPTYLPVHPPEGASPASYRDPVAGQLYEVAAVGETVQRYVASHLALTDSGLWLTLDESAYRMRLSASGWEVLDADGQAVTATLADAQGHVTSTLGRLDGLHLTVTETSLAFSHPSFAEPVAWIEVDPDTGASAFHIDNAVVMRELRLGSWKWIERAGGNLALKWMGD